MTLILHAPIGPEAARPQKILTVAAFAGVEIKTTPTYQYGVENETEDWVRTCNPLGRFPALETPEGHLFESNAIARYIARLDKTNSGLYGRTPFEASQCDMWLDFAATEIDTANFPFLLYGFGYGDIPTADQAAKVDCVLTGLEIWLETRTFLVGERISVADICVAFSLQWVFRFHYDYPQAEALTKKFRNVWRLYNTVMQQPKTIEVLKQTGGTFGLRKPVEEKKAAAPAAAKPKEEKKAAKKDDEEEEDDVPKEEKKANPLDALPPSPFVLDAFKREYSNTDTRTQAAPWFFANYDAAGYTAFWCKYKYNEDNKMQFMTANLIRGWFQRMEHTRKYAFGIALIVGEEKKHEIRGLWIFRGKGMPEIVREVEDTELFDWEEIADVQAKKAEITDYFAWEGPTIDKPVLEGRCFK